MSGSLVDVFSTGRGRLGPPLPGGAASPPPAPLLTARTVAGILGVCTETVLRWIRNDELPPSIFRAELSESLRTH
jgi:hypothetical protein